MLTALVNAGFQIIGTWPMRTERAARSNALETNSLATSVVLVCRPRPEDAPLATRGQFLGELASELPRALEQLTHEGHIAPVDLAQAAIGPGMKVYSRYRRVETIAGEAVTVREALAEINREVARHHAREEGALDGESRFCAGWLRSHGYAEGPFGEAETLARALNVTVEGLSPRLLEAVGGKVRLLRPERFGPDGGPRLGEPTAWEGLFRMAWHLWHEDGDGTAGAAALARSMGSGAAAVERLARILNEHFDPRGGFGERGALQQRGRVVGGDRAAGHAAGGAGEAGAGAMSAGGGTPPFAVRYRLRRERRPLRRGHGARAGAGPLRGVRAVAAVGHDGGRVGVPVRGQVGAVRAATAAGPPVGGDESGAAAGAAGFRGAGGLFGGVDGEPRGDGRAGDGGDRGVASGDEPQQAGGLSGAGGGGLVRWSTALRRRRGPRAARVRGNATRAERRTVSINVAIIGVGNCASSLVQGLEFYRHVEEGDEVPGIMHPVAGGYHINDIRVTVAIDIDAQKVGKDLSEAVFAGQNNTLRFAEVPHAGVTVERGMTHDGLGQYLGGVIEKAPGGTADIARLLREHEVDVVVNYLPVGSEEATKWYVEQTLAAGLRLHQLHSRVHRAGRERLLAAALRGGRAAHRGGRHQEPGGGDHRAPRADAAVRGPRGAAGPHVPAEFRREHGLLQHAGAFAAGVEEDFQDVGGDEPGGPRGCRRTTCTWGRATTCRGWTTASGATSAWRARPSGTRR